MPKIGMEPIRRAALVDAAIAEIGRAGSLDVTVSQIAKAAGMSSALAHHYFGGKEQIFAAAMRHILKVYGDGVRAALTKATGPRARLSAIVHASFAPENFRQEVISAWLTFYVQAQTSAPARRLLSVYQQRLHSNLRHEFKSLLPAKDADLAAELVASLIDGFYIRMALAPNPIDVTSAEQLVMDCIAARLAGAQ